MEQAVETMITAYESGKMSRRDLIRALVALPAISALRTAPAPFKGVSLNHVTVLVSDLPKLTEFYQKLLGLKLMHQIGGNNYLNLGQSFLCLAQAREGGAKGVNHFSIGVENFDADKVLDFLAKENLVTRTNPKGEIYFIDPDGLRVQLSSTTYNGEGRG
jgi:catechol 2,3-dioxygenase-like lactoylglutathione lyase family enzyme